MPKLSKSIRYPGGLLPHPVQATIKAPVFSFRKFEVFDDNKSAQPIVQREKTGENTLPLTLSGSVYSIELPENTNVQLRVDYLSGIISTLGETDARYNVVNLEDMAFKVEVTVDNQPPQEFEVLEGFYFSRDKENLTATHGLVLYEPLYFNKEVFTRLVDALNIGVFGNIAFIALFSAIEKKDGGFGLNKDQYSTALSGALRSIFLKMYQENEENSAQTNEKLKKIAQAVSKFDVEDLFDFPLKVAKLNHLTNIEGTFTIETGQSVKTKDLSFYRLQAEYSNGAEAVVEVFDWNLAAPDAEIANTPVPFAFAINDAVVGELTLTVKGFDSSVLWQMDFEADDEQLSDVQIRVPLLRPGVLSSSNSGSNAAIKKLRGQVIQTADSHAHLKDLTVLIQAKKEGDTLFRIVGSAQTDQNGNFSLAYPFGVYTEAQAIVSVVPDSPTPIEIRSGNAANETIADDFLYLLIGALPEEEESDDGCACHSGRKAKRLPDHADLIASDEYTQDMGSSCMSLTTPNRTLREYNYQAIVRVSDPDVANYTLEKIEQPNGDFAFRLTGDKKTIKRRAVNIDNPIRWQDAPDAHENLSLYQAVTIATGHILHYKSKFKADGYSLGDLLYTLPLAPGQKKQIVVFDAAHSLSGQESQRVAQGERLSADLLNDRTITDQLSGSIGESLSGSSSANTSGMSGGLGLGGSFGPIGGSLGVAGGFSNSNSNASQNSGRNISQFFGERLRQSIMQNAESFRELNASVVTTVQEGQQYSASTEVVSNHNHCHGLTLMYFEVLRHYAIYQELSGVEECVFVPFLMTNFTKENIYKWKDVLAPRLLPVHSNTYLQPNVFLLRGRQHPLLKAFDANDRIKTNYEHVEFPNGMFADERITELTGQMALRIHIPRPKTRFDRILSFPVIKKTITSRGDVDVAGTIRDNIVDSVVGAVVPCAAKGPSISYQTNTTEVLTRKAIFDMFMTLDANYETVPPAHCIRVNFNGPNNLFENFIGLTFHGDLTPTPMDFFAGMETERTLWTAYAKILGMSLKELFQYFNGNVVADWDRIFQEHIAPLIVEKLVNNDRFSFLPLGQMDLSVQGRYAGGERVMTVNLQGSTSLTRKDISALTINYNFPGLTANERSTFFNFVTFNLENIDLRYSTKFSNGVLLRRTLRNDLRDNVPPIPTPLNSDEKRNPRKEDIYLVRQLMEHLNSNLEYYNKILLFHLDADRRYMLLDGFNIQIFSAFGNPIGYRSLASVVKNQLVGVAGNSLVFPVAEGYRVSQSYIVEAVDDALPEDAGTQLLKQYEPLTPMEPYRISVPTKGVYLETVQSACNACEKVYPNSSQDWDKFRTDEPTTFAPVVAPTPVVTDWKAAFKDFATPIVNIQNAPAAPDPGAGLSGLNELLGKAGVFNDITGLQGNQQNAIRTYLSNNENAKAFAEMAKGLAMQQHNTEHADTITNSLNQARESGAITPEQHQRLTEQHIEQQIDGGESRRDQARTEREATRTSLTDVAAEAAQEGRNVSAQRTDTDGNVESLVIGESSASDDPASVALTNNSVALRAFHPDTNSKSGEIELIVNVSGIPAPVFLWENIGGSNVAFLSPNAASTVVQGLKPGLHQVKVGVRSGATMGSRLYSRAVTLSVPQFVRITENATEFDAALRRLHVDHLKNDIIQEMKRACDSILSTSNVRTIWQIGGFGEIVPSFIPAAHVTTVTLRNLRPGSPGLLGDTDPTNSGNWGPTTFNEGIEVYAGAYTNPSNSPQFDADTETQALVLQFESLAAPDPSLDGFAIKVFGRLFGETTSHEILHSLLGLISTSPANAHNPGTVTHDIMNPGATRTFTQRTGLVNNAQSSPVVASNYTDNGISAINRLQSANQARMDGLFPIRP